MASWARVPEIAFTLDSRAGNGAVAIRLRRQVGKSRLVQEFCDRSGVPYLFFTATKGASPVEAVAEFVPKLGESLRPTDGELVPAVASGSWPDAFRVLASALPARPPDTSPATRQRPAHDGAADGL